MDKFVYRPTDITESIFFVTKYFPSVTDITADQLLINFTHHAVSTSNPQLRSHASSHQLCVSIAPQLGYKRLTNDCKSDTLAIALPVRLSIVC